MLQIHFTTEDLTRIRLATGPEPLWEILLSLHKLADTDGRLVFDQWRRQVRDRIPPSARWLLDLAPPHGNSPDFLTPLVGGRSLHEGLDTILATPHRRVHTDIATLAVNRPLRGPAIDLADGARGALHELNTALRDYYEAALAPYWTLIRASIQADLAIRGQTLMHAGAEQLLKELRPQAEWCPPVLRVPYTFEHSIDLRGRGLLLIPSFFCWKQPITFCDPELTPVLVFPITHSLDWLHPAPPPAARRSWAKLVGRTRAEVLAGLAAGPCTTTQLAQRAGISLASASQHAATLREVGLLTTRRHGSYVIHTLTPLGARIFDGS